jgi:dihydrofolate reductase
MHPREERSSEMGKVIVMNGLSLDGVMQSPGRPDEDTRDGFKHGGWAAPYGDETMVGKLGDRLRRLTGGKHAWLFGHRTYDELLSSWNAQGGPFKDPLNNIRKYVASSNPATTLEWPNSTLLHGDVPAAVAELKQTADTDLVIMGSGVLIRSLMAADLIDAYLLTIAPLVLGSGRPMFTDGVHTSMRLTDTTTTAKGVIVATYETV